MIEEKYQLLCIQVFKTKNVERLTNILDFVFTWDVLL